MNESPRPLYWFMLGLIGLVIATSVLFPVFWLFLASFKTRAELAALPIAFWTQSPTPEAYTALASDTRQKGSCSTVHLGGMEPAGRVRHEPHGHPARRHHRCRKTAIVCEAFGQRCEIHMAGWGNLKVMGTTSEDTSEWYEKGLLAPGVDYDARPLPAAQLRPDGCLGPRRAAGRTGARLPAHLEPHRREQASRMTIHRRAWTMRLQQGAEAACDKAHPEIWPELLRQMRGDGVRSFLLFRSGLTVFAVHERARPFPAPTEPPREIAARWWQEVARLMVTDESGRPVRTPLSEVFSLNDGLPGIETSK